MEEMFQFLQENSITVAQLWRYLQNFNEKRNFELLYHHIHDQFKAEKLLEALDFNTDIEDKEVPEKTLQVLLELESEEVLENPTKKMKIDDPTSSTVSENESENC